MGTFFWKVGDTAIIDNGIVNGSAKLVGAIAAQCVSPNRLYLHLRRRYGIRRIGTARHDLLGIVPIRIRFQTALNLQAV